MNKSGKIFCLDDPGCDMYHKTEDYLEQAKFLFNVTEHLEQAAHLAKPKCYQCHECKGAGSDRLWCAVSGQEIKDDDEYLPQCEGAT